ncbi:site-specific integrase [Carboxylicivirga sp. N1Y90]|uniref:site-specific integrase n=1 Tax=Carboxylicivirga fragile TaxID=3417571 RepID=UPI003D359AAB|nr:site-specific integrase [Marinilabiliaceae bacterium N1Y90]
MNNTPTFGVQFICRLKSKKTDMAGIYLRITVNGRKTELSTKLQCPFSLWDNSKERVKSDSKFNYRNVNRLIDDNRAKIQNIYQKLRYSNELITPIIIKNHFIGIKEEGHTLLKIIDYHYKAQQEALNTHTLRHYKTSYGYLKAFLKHVKKTNDIYLSQIDYQFICDYEAFLRTYQPDEDNPRTLAQNTLMKQLSRFRTILNLANKLGWMEHYPFKSYRLSFKKSSRKYLTQAELDNVVNKEFTIQRLSQTKDMFVFSCYTGLAYSDVARLTKDSIVKGIDGNDWIHTSRKKTEAPVRIPLLSISKMIIEKYSDHPHANNNNRLFPIASNQKLNGYLKEIADICGINKNLTFHMARHTFATTVTLTNGVPIETVSKILGHTKIATTQIYAKVLENKVSEDMNTLKSKLESNNNNGSLAKFKQTN